MRPLPAVAVIGLGLIGSSVARAARRAFPGIRITGVDPSPETRRYALTVGLVDEAFAAAAEVSRWPELAVIATPVSRIGAAAAAVARAAEGAIRITDAGSVKRLPMREAEAEGLAAGAVFVPAHPVAGSEKSGPEHGFADVFQNRLCLLTPFPGANEADIAAVERFWQALGMETARMDAVLHDTIYALVSHLPQQLAFAFWQRAEALGLTPAAFAPSMDEFLRLTRANRLMWREIFEANADMLTRFRNRYDALFARLHPALGEAPAAAFTDGTLACAMGQALLSLVHEVEGEIRSPLISYASTGFRSFISLAELTSRPSPSGDVP